MERPYYNLINKLNEFNEFKVYNMWKFRNNAHKLWDKGYSKNNLIFRIIKLIQSLESWTILIERNY